MMWLDDLKQISQIFPNKIHIYSQSNYAQKWILNNNLAIFSHQLTTTGGIASNMSARAIIPH